MANKNPKTGIIVDDENPFPASLNAKILEVMKKDQRARQTPVYDLFKENGFNEADILTIIHGEDNGKITKQGLGYHVAVVDNLLTTLKTSVPYKLSKNYINKYILSLHKKATELENSPSIDSKAQGIDLEARVNSLVNKLNQTPHYNLT